VTLPIDVLTLGRVGVDLYPLQSGSGLEEVTTFGKFLGGTATNVAVAAARHGRRAAVITATGADPFGRFVRKALLELGVDARFVSTVPHLLTPVAFCEVFPPDHFPIYFYRAPKAPDLEIDVRDLDLDAIAAARIFWFTTSGLSQEPSRRAHHVALEARARARHTILDLDYRRTFWESSRRARAEIKAVLPSVTIAIGNLEECEIATGRTEPEEAAAELICAGVELAIVKLGSRGVLGRTAAQTVVVEPHHVEVVNGLGAGDGFGGAICHALLEDWSLEESLRFASTAGAIVASRLECSSAMPTTAEVNAAMEKGVKP
jgi:5-dehydro-2-deoxygluconokinase